MRSCIIISAIILTSSSCATILNSKKLPIDIITTKPAKIILNNDTLLSVENRIKIEVARQKKPIELKIIGDSISKSIKIQSQNSPAYWLNLYPYFLAGFLIDRNSPKRYAFPSPIYVNMSDNTSKYSVFNRRDRPGKWFLNISIPLVNSFYLKPEKESRKSNTGFLGISASVEYYHDKNQFINCTLSGVMDSFPFPAIVDYRGWHEHISSSFIAISNNHKKRNFSLGYGLSYSRNMWVGLYTGPTDTLSIDQQPKQRSSKAIGFVFPIHYQLGRSFYAGVIYRPTFFRFAPSPRVVYEDLISIDLGWKIRLKKQ